ncbi:MAG TPA: methyltransferase domain-containing protein [Baekduia sp.]|nr:methyltransferase domain-containing protein [Baekduia sp.]
MSSATPDWDARTYHRVSAPHQDWAEVLLDRLALRGDETVLDAGCGTGRVTEKLLARLPRGRVIAVDGAPSMVAEARRVLGARATVAQSDLLALELDAPVDAVFSSAVFHWIDDHDTLFARLHAALRPGGRLVAQCGGAGNIARFLAAAAAVGERAPYAEHLAGFSGTGTWRFATAEETADRLGRAGFTDVRTWLQPWDVTPPEPAAFVRSVCLHPHAERLPDDLVDPFIADVLAAAGDPLVLDYVRLNIEARRPA